MYGPPPPWPPSAPPTPYPGYGVPPQRPSLAARVGLIALRTVLACVPVCTIGILAWVPLVRLAVVRRGAWDWVAVVVTGLVSSSAFVAVGSARDDNSFQANAGGSGLVLVAMASTVYFLVMELRTPSAPRQAPFPHPFAHPLGLSTVQPTLQPSVQPTLQPFAGTPWPAPVAPVTQLAPGAPVVPLGQVQAELDELSALLRGRPERPAP